MTGNKKFDSVDDIICAYLDKKNAHTKTQRGFDYWSASSLGKCKRLQFLTRKDTTVSNNGPYKWKNNAEDGNVSHIWRQLAVKEMGALIASEDSITDEELHYRGHFDLLVMLSDGLTLCDIKNQKAAAFRKRQRLANKIQPEHKRQLGSYFLFLRKKYPALKNARLYYINRDTGERDEIIVIFTEEYLNEIKQELKDLNNYWDKNILPQKEISPFCKYVCKFYDTCNKLGNVSGQLHVEVKQRNKAVPKMSNVQTKNTTVRRAGQSRSGTSIYKRRSRR